MTSVVYCFNIEKKELSYLKVLPLEIIATQYVNYINNLFRLLNMQNDNIVFTTNVNLTSFTVMYNTPDNIERKYNKYYNILYKDNKIYYNEVTIENIKDSIKKWNILTKKIIDENYIELPILDEHKHIDVDNDIHIPLNETDIVDIDILDVL